MTDGMMIVAGIIEKARTIEREKNWKALTEGEAKTLRAASFLEKIAPYLSLAAVDPADAHSVDPSTRETKGN